MILKDAYLEFETEILHFIKKVTFTTQLVYKQSLPMALSLLVLVLPLILELLLKDLFREEKRTSN